MRHESTVFVQLLKAIPRGWFAKAVAAHRQGRAKRTLSEWRHLVAMVLAQLSGSCSLRDLGRMVERHPGAMAHLALGPVARSTLSDANATRPAALFEAVAARLSAMAGGHRLGKEAVRLIDATRIYAGKKVEAWAKGGVKLHLGFDPDGSRPVWFAVTRDRVNDITAAKTMPVEPGLTYVFDKGYYDFSFWARLHDAKCRFVTRLKKNAPTTLVEERRPEGEAILSDRVVTLSERIAGKRQNPLQAKVRLIATTLDTGGEIIVLTNDLDAPAAEIAALYKARWQIELYFKWIKQNLKLAHFLGTSHNALVIQIMAALIAYLLLRLATITHNATIGLQAFARLMPTTLFARRPLATVLEPPPPPIQTGQTPQMELAYP